jgi:hypothetical protein
MTESEDAGGPPPEGVAFAEPEPEPEPAQPTAPVTVRPSIRPRRSGPLVRMGPWAPVAGALLGAVLGAVAVLLLAGSADAFAQRLALVLLIVGMGLLGASGPLLADEVRLVRRSVREAAVRPAWAETTAGLLNGLTPARLLLLVSGFVLFLSAYVARG